jgi:GntR family transcriptional regulator, transcriptional repressor for pyruvate dehydrogenase complex
MAPTKKTKAKSPIDIAAARLRQLALTAADAELLGSEGEIVRRLVFSRVTIRQAARLLERDGVLRVRRGIRGGYFAARPKVEMVEAVFCAYLDTLGLDARHTGAVATALWVEAMREAAIADRKAARLLAERLTETIEKLPAELTIDDVSTVQQEVRSAVFELIGGRYLELLFRVNAAFARQQLGVRMRRDDPTVHRRFVRQWKKAVLLELEAIAEGDGNLAVVAAMHNRKLWIARMFEMPDTSGRAHSAH